MVLDSCAPLSNFMNLQKNLKHLLLHNIYNLLNI
jgi:hypothetical protein